MAALCRHRAVLTLGGVKGGFAAGWLWTAQGAFFARTAQLLAAAYGMEEPVSDSAAPPAAAAASICFTVARAAEGDHIPRRRLRCVLRGLRGETHPPVSTPRWLIWYSQVLMKGLASLLHRWGGDVFVNAVFTTAAGVAALATLFVKELPAQPKTDEQARAATVRLEPQLWAHILLTLCLARRGQLAAERLKRPSLLSKIMLALNLLWRSRKMQLLSTLNISFGLTSAFVTQWVNGTLVKEAVVSARGGTRLRCSSTHPRSLVRARTMLASW